MASLSSARTEDQQIFGKTQAEVRAALEQAEPNALRMAVYQATRDPELAAMGVDTTMFWAGAFEFAALRPEHVAAVREKAFEFLRAGAAERKGSPSEQELRGMMDLMKGAPVGDYIYDLGRGDLVDEEFPLGVEWDEEPSQEVKSRFKVAIIGAGLGGLAAAIQFGRLGIPYTIIERNSGPGGTWWVNNFPGARVDVVSHQYQYSFVKHYPWKHYFATRAELKDYVETVVDRYDLSPNIRYDTSVVSSTWNEDSSSWHLKLANKDGGEEEFVANALISAAGLFNTANMPDIPGIESFKGAVFHSTDWDLDYDYSGKRVAQIGVGATGVQVLPAIAPQAEHVTVFQRSPQWVMPMEGYLAGITSEVQWLFDNIPHYWNWYSFSAFMTIGGAPEGLFNYDREWQKSGGIVSKRNDAIGVFSREYIKSKIGDDPELMAKVVPSFPAWVKRPIIDGGWYDALKRENVDLITDEITKVTTDGIVTADGRERKFDLIALCSGFGTERFLWPVRYEGRNGVSLEDVWAKDGARAYLSLTLPDFPNMFMLYGPNGQVQTGGGLIKWLEIWGRYAVKSIVKMVETGTRSMSLKHDVFDTYNSRLDERMKDCIWDYEGQSSYYVNKFGRPSINAPWQPPEYYQWLYAPDMTDYDLK